MINIKNNTKFSVFVIIASSLLALLIISSVFISSYSNIYWNIKVNDISVGGLSPAKAKEVLEAARGQQTFKEKIYVTSKNATMPLDVIAVDPKYSIDDTLKDITEYGHTGSIFKRIPEIMTCLFGRKVFDMSITLNEKPIDDLVLELSKKVDSEEVLDKVSFNNNIMTITRGSKGDRLNKDAAKGAIRQAVLNAVDDTVKLEPEIVEPELLTVQKVHELVGPEPTDAKFEVIANKVTIIPEKPGVIFDEKELERILSESKDKREIKIGVTLKKANINEATLKTMLFKNKLAGYSSKYNSADVNRTSNLTLAANKINGIILGAGDQFSYNRVVGPRDAAHGFKVAKVYVGDQIEDGMGGGICQVSSTLYNSVLLSDLSVTTRSNHSLSISYVPLGLDATVSYGYLDFVFVNNTNYPVKITATIGGGTLSISIYGTNENPGKSIEIVTESAGSTPFKVKTVEDPTLPDGQIVVEKAGTRGASVNTYKKVYQDGRLVSTIFLHKSTYLPLDRVERVGIGGPAPSATAAPNVAATPQTTALPSFAPSNNPPTGTAPPNPSTAAPTPTASTPPVTFATDTV